MHPNYCQTTILLVVELCSSLAYFIMTQPLPIARKLPIKTLISKQLPTNTHTHTRAYTFVGSCFACASRRHSTKYACGYAHAIMRESASSSASASVALTIMTLHAGGLSQPCRSLPVYFHSRFLWTTLACSAASVAPYRWPLMS